MACQFGLKIRGNAAHRCLDVAARHNVFPTAVDDKQDETIGKKLAAGQARPG